MILQVIDRQSAVELQTLVCYVKYKMNTFYEIVT